MNLKLTQETGIRGTCPTCNGKGTVASVGNSDANGNRTADHGHPVPCPVCLGKKFVLHWGDGS